MGYALTLTAFRTGQAICYVASLLAMCLPALATSAFGCLILNRAGDAPMGILFGAIFLGAAVLFVVGAVLITNEIEDWRPPRRPRRRRRRA